MKFDVGKKLQVDGTIRILGGLGTQKVVLTSILDDTILGDTGGDGYTTGYPGAWRGIEFTDTSDDVENLVDHAEVRFAGDEYFPSNGGITLEHARPTITDTKFAHCAYSAIVADLQSYLVEHDLTFDDNELNGLAFKPGTIDADTTWNMTTVPHVLLGDVAVAPSKTLVISPGIVVKSGGAALIVNGSLHAVGTDVAPVYFTSLNDDELFNDTNNDGFSQGYPGAWYGIKFTDSSDDPTSIIDHAWIRFAGDEYSPDHGGITLDHASPTITNTKISQCAYGAIVADLQSYLVEHDIIFDDNTINGLAFEPGTIAANTVWNMTTVPHVLLGDVEVAAGRRLTISPGVVVKSGGGALIVNGSLHAVGTDVAPVYFTSVNDDELFNDTNNDGFSQGYPGAWYGIKFTDSSDDLTSIIDHAWVRFAGDEYSPDHGGITLDHASPRITNAKISECAYAAILASQSSPTLNCNRFSDLDLTVYGIRNQTIGVIIDAPYHWWGSPTGPKNAASNPKGTGKPVTDGVQFVPWLHAENESCPGPIFEDGFESGGLTMWSAASTDGV